MTGSSRRDSFLLHRMVEDAIDLDPHRTALEAGHISISFAELDRRANQIAHALLALGPAADARVAILMGRGIDCAAAMLGVLKSGAAFVPLDPEWPRERINAALNNCGAIACLSGGPHSADISPLIPVIEVAPGSSALADQPHTRPECVSILPSHLACVIHTSGSTGRPKGVMIGHGAISRHLRAMARIHRLGPDDRSLWFHAPAFDPTIEQLFGALVASATVVIRDDAPWSGPAFDQVVREKWLTTATLPAACWMQLLRDWDADDAAPPLASLRRIIVGGEALPPAAVALWRKLDLTHIRLFNAYGPTECTVTATVHEVSAREDATEVCGRVPIGRPHAELEAFILAPDGRIVPSGAIGELCFMGRTLARGYLGHERLTAEKFIPHPAVPDSRLYHTGDLARRHPDGTLDLLGRMDDQVKIRGHRIELAEVETALNNIDGIAQSAVIAVDKGDGDRHLAAFLVATGGGSPDPVQLRWRLAQHLPVPAIPAEFHICAEFPLTRNSKIDREALARQWAAATLAGRPTSSHPAASVAEIVSDVWRECLRAPRLAEDANVFEHGASSLTVARVHRALESALGCAIRITLLFEHTSIRALARALAPATAPAMTGAIAGAGRQRAASSASKAIVS